MQASHRTLPFKCIWGFPKIKGTLSGVPMLRIIAFWGFLGSLLGSPYFRKLPYSVDFGNHPCVSFRQQAWVAVARARLALGAKREAYRAVQEARKGGG